VFIIIAPSHHTIDLSEIKALSKRHKVNNGENGRNQLASDGGSFMSKKKKKESSGPMPAASAGLLRFFEEETEGIKVRPELLIAASIALIIVCILAQVFFK
jgi:preprotein translocase subunit Sec61beta